VHRANAAALALRSTADGIGGLGYTGFSGFSTAPAKRIEAELCATEVRATEVRAAESADPTLYARRVTGAAHKSGRGIAVVSNNSR
jgi:hypothetical protein